MTEKINFEELSHKIVFIFFDPWSVHSTLHYSITKTLLDYGFNIIDYNYRFLNESHLEHIYRKNHPIKEESSWQIPREVYTLGQCCGMLLYMDKNSSSSACETLKNIKGKSSPYLNERGKIRFDFKAPNKSLSLIHSSDDWESALNECKPFFTEDIILNSLQRFLKNNNLKKNVFFSKQYTPITKLADLSFVNLVLKLKMRILDTIFFNIPTISEKELYYSIKKHSEDDFSLYGLIEELRKYLKIIHNEKKPLDLLIEHIKSLNVQLPDDSLWINYNVDINYLIKSLRILNNTDKYSVIDTNDFISKTGVFMDDWEKLLFKTTLFHFNDFLDYEKNYNPGL